MGIVSVTVMWLQYVAEYDDKDMVIKEKWFDHVQKRVGVSEYKRKMQRQNCLMV